MRNFFAHTLFAGVSLALTAGIVAASATPAAAAIPTVDAPQALVRYSDLNLADKQARSTLDSRIHAAANAVCPTSGSAADFAAMQCRETAIKQAHSDIADRLAMRSAAVTQNAAP